MAIARWKETLNLSNLPVWLTLLVSEEWFPLGEPAKIKSIIKAY